MAASALQLAFAGSTAALLGVVGHGGRSCRDGSVPALLYLLHPVILGAALTRSDRFGEDLLLVAVFLSCTRRWRLPALLYATAFLWASPLQGAALLPHVLTWLFVHQSLAGAGGKSGGAPLSPLTAQRPPFSFMLGAGVPLLVAAVAGAAGVADMGLPARGLRPVALSPDSSAASLGLTWYLFAEAFSRYIPYFTLTVWLHPFLYTLPLLIRFRDRPDVAFIAQLTLTALFDPSEAYSLHRFPLALALAAATPDVSAEMSAPVLWLGLSHFALAVAPLMKGLWLGEAGEGNANFLFNQSVLFALAVGCLVADFLAAALRLRRRERRLARGGA